MYQWRDSVAREEDESCTYVCGATALIRVAIVCPTEIRALRISISPLPTLVSKYAQDIIGLVVETLSQFRNKGETCDTTTFISKRNTITLSPSMSTLPILFCRNSLPSPVLNAKSLYEQAGWMTPTIVENDNHVTNKYHTSLKTLTQHSLFEKYRTTIKGKEVILRETPSMALFGNQEETRRAHSRTLTIRKSMEQKDFLGLLSMESVNFDTEHKKTNKRDETSQDSLSKSDVSNSNNYTPINEIPKSMREIYQISNRNRNRNKSKCINFPKLLIPTEDKDETIEEAEHLLATSGLNGTAYFNTVTKRRRTKDSNQTNEMDQNENIVSYSTLQENMDFMVKIGWVKTIQELNDMKQEEPGLADTNNKVEKTNLKETKAPYEIAASTTDKHKIKPIKQLSKSSSERKKCKSPQRKKKPFDYSTVGDIGIMAGRLSVNP